jgi:hypothetical protein
MRHRLARKPFKDTVSHVSLILEKRTHLRTGKETRFSFAKRYTPTGQVRTMLVSRFFLRVRPLVEEAFSSSQLGK